MNRTEICKALETLTTLKNVYRKIKQEGATEK